MTPDQAADQLIKDLNVELICLLDSREEPVQLLFRSKRVGWEIEKYWWKRWQKECSKSWEDKCKNYLKKRAKANSFNLVVVPKVLYYDNDKELYFHTYADDLNALFVQTRIVLMYR